MLIESLVAALLISLFAGGRLKSLIELKLKGVTLLILAVLFQTIAFQATQHHFLQEANAVIPVLHTISYLFLIGFAWLNRTLPGVYIFAAGVALNALVIGLNGGLMPVDPAILPEASRQVLLNGTGTHGLLTEETKLKLLADHFYAEIPGLSKQLFSLGDIFIDIGIGYLIIKAMISGRKEEKSQNFNSKPIIRD